MAVHDDTLAAALRICRESGRWLFKIKDVVGALPHLNPGTVRTHVGSRCCVNAPKNHPHKWDYFRRTGRGEYEIYPAYRQSPTKSRAAKGRIAEEPAVYARTESLRDVIHVVVRRSSGFYVGETMEVAVVSQGRSLDELLANLKEAITLHLSGENPAALGLVRHPRLAVTYEDPDAIDGQA